MRVCARADEGGHGAEVSFIVADIFGEGSVSYLSSEPERTESFHFTHRSPPAAAAAAAARSPGPDRLGARGCAGILR